MRCCRARWTRRPTGRRCRTRTVPAGSAPTPSRTSSRTCSPTAPAASRARPSPSERSHRRRPSGLTRPAAVSRVCHCSRMPPMTTRSVLAIAALALAVSGCAAAPPTPTTAAAPAAPAPAPSASAPPSGPISVVLPNGLRLITQDHRAGNIVAIYLWIGVGVRYDKPDELGYSHFMEHMLFKGTDKWGPGYIDRAVEGVGGRSNAVTSFDYTTFYIVVPREATETAIQLLHDMAFRSAFEPAEIARERDVIFEEARIETDNPRTAIIRQLYGMVFEGHPYGRPVLGV